jgi:hypothetical protein
MLLQIIRNWPVPERDGPPSAEGTKGEKRRCRLNLPQEEWRNMPPIFHVCVLRKMGSIMPELGK